MTNEVSDTVGSEADDIYDHVVVLWIARIAMKVPTDEFGTARVDPVEKAAGGSKVEFLSLRQSRETQLAGRHDSNSHPTTR